MEYIGSGCSGAFTISGGVLSSIVIGLKPVVTISARDTDDPALEIHSTTPAWH